MCFYNCDMTTLTKYLQAKIDGPIEFKRREEKRNEKRCIQRIENKYRTYDACDETPDEREQRQAKKERQRLMARDRTRKSRAKKMEREMIANEAKGKLVVEVKKECQKNIIMTIETDCDNKENIQENRGTVGIKISQKTREPTGVCREQREIYDKEQYMRTITGEFESKSKVTLKDKLNQLNRKVDNVGFGMDEGNIDGVHDDSSRIVSTFRYMTAYKQPEANMTKKIDQWQTISVTKSDMCQSLLKRGSYVNDSVIRYYRGCYWKGSWQGLQYRSLQQ